MHHNKTDPTRKRDEKVARTHVRISPNEHLKSDRSLMRSQNTAYGHRRKKTLAEPLQKTILRGDCGKKTDFLVRLLLCEKTMLLSQKKTSPAPATKNIAPATRKHGDVPNPN